MPAKQPVSPLVNLMAFLDAYLLMHSQKKGAFQQGNDLLKQFRVSTGDIHPTQVIALLLNAHTGVGNRYVDMPIEAARIVVEQIASIIVGPDDWRLNDAVRQFTAQFPWQKVPIDLLNDAKRHGRAGSYVIHNGQIIHAHAATEQSQSTA